MLKNIYWVLASSIFVLSACSGSGSESPDGLLPDGSEITTAENGAEDTEHCGEVSITNMNWASSQVVTAIAKQILEDGYGCSVVTVPSNSANALQSIAESGKPDIATEVWTNDSNAYDELLSSEKIVSLSNVLADGGVEAWWIPSYLARQHPELTTLEGIVANPDLINYRFHNCPTGWQCQIVNTNLLKAAFADIAMDNYIPESSSALDASMAVAVENEEPWLGYYWAPTPLLGKYEMTMVDIGDYDTANHSCNGLEDCASPKISAYPVSDVYTVATTEFVESHPAVSNMLRKMTFTNTRLNSLLAWEQQNNASKKDVAIYFLKNHTDVWSSWVGEDMKEKIVTQLN